MNKIKFKQGDRVRIISNKSRYKGKIGTVQGHDSWGCYVFVRKF